MRAAYNKYRYASELVKAAASSVPIPISPGDETPRMTILTVEQCSAFENYIEARLQYSEFERDQDRFRTAGSTTVQRDHQADGPRGKRVRFRGPLVAVSIALVSVIALSFSLITPEIKPQDPMPASLGQGRNGLRSVARKSDGRSVPPTSMPRNIVDPPPSQITRKIAREEQPSRLRPHNHEFTLTPSRKFKKVGPMSISLRGVDSRRQILDLLVKQEGSKPAKMRISVKKPVWVTAAGGSRRIELVATQIQRNRVHVFLNEVKNYKSEDQFESPAGAMRGFPSGF